IAVGSVILLFVSAITLGMTVRAALADRPATAGPYDWLQFGGDAQHSLNNTSESAISATNVASLQTSFQVSLPGPVDSPLLLLTNVTTASGVRDLLFAETSAGQTVALDSHTGAQIWVAQHLAGSCTFPTGTACYTDAAPAIDPN